MSIRTLMALVGFCCLAWLAGCGKSGIKKLAAPDQSNVELVRIEFSSEAESGVPKPDPLAGRIEAAWATLNVSVKYDGPNPPPAALTITKDPSVCQPGGKPVFDNKIEIGKDGSLGNVLLYLSTDLPADDSDESEPIWVHSRYSIAKHPELANAEFDQKQCLFLSPVFAMRSKQTLKILNSDPIGHNTKLDTRKAAPLNESIAADSFITYEPGAEERQPFGVSCSIHPWMTAFMITRDTPYFGVSQVKEQGKFTIADIPAGVELEYRIWIANKFADGGTATLKLDGTDVEIKRGGKIKLTLTPGATQSLDLVVNSSAFSG